MAKSDDRETVLQTPTNKEVIALDAFNLRSDARKLAIDEEVDNARRSTDSGQAATPDFYLTKVGNDWVDSGSELTETGIYEAEISRSCFVVGGLQSLTLNSTDSGAFSLGPNKGSAKLLLPSEAIPPGCELTVRYSTLLDGPFCIPKDCYIVSPVLYIDYDTSLVKRPLELNLSHWYAGNKRQNTMTFLKAPHVAAEDGFFHFDKCDSGSFLDDEQFGVLELHNHLCLICDAVQRTPDPQLCPPMMCRVMLLTKQVKDPQTVPFALYVTFDDAAWIMVIEEHVVANMGWAVESLAGPQPISLRGQERDRSDGVEFTAEPTAGHYWTIDHEGCSNMPCRLMLEWLERYHGNPRVHCNRLQEEIAKRLFPPCIQLRLTYDSDPTRWTSKQKVLLMVNTFMTPNEHVQFPLQVKVPGDDNELMPPRIPLHFQQQHTNPDRKFFSTSRSPKQMALEPSKQLVELFLSGKDADFSAFLNMHSKMAEEQSDELVELLLTVKEFLSPFKLKKTGLSDDKKPEPGYFEALDNAKDTYLTEKQVPSQNHAGRLSEHYSDALTDTKAMLLRVVDVNEPLMNQLQTHGILTCDEVACVREEPSNSKKMNQIIGILLDKGDNEFLNFCRILGMNGSDINAWVKAVLSQAVQEENSAEGEGKHELAISVVAPPLARSKTCCSGQLQDTPGSRTSVDEPHPTQSKTAPPCSSQPPVHPGGTPYASSVAGSDSVAVQSILKRYENMFFDDVNAKHNVLKLKRKGVIPKCVAAKLESLSDEEASEVLYDHLLNHGTVDTLREWCKWAITAKGFPKMQELGRIVKNELLLLAQQPPSDGHATGSQL